MLAKSFILSLGLYAILGPASPTPEVSVDPKRYVYKSGSCDSGWEDQPKPGWVWAGQCKNFDSFTYGARARKNDESWTSSCTSKFWKNADCHGHATVHHLADSIEWKNGAWGVPYQTYQCIATANKASGEFYLGNGAASVLMTC
ncbi:hypothetical protein CNMCM6805_001734 [Aspergillus fumigatiaffinis]|uniref:Secreted protein n=1 Tax=Aspergillus fumigatiaffinis TaxID=340414 RepID=A0A8H4HDN9_9EURO|nr:hypothetical protein CNMCM5878_002762 [Aspergillus fumigatiaffinis]KAF4243132.1 hypothetical protein CNMCM6805_001734 [Aspergillus fumigatiaffinis]